MVSLRDMLSEAVGREWADKNPVTDVEHKRRGRAPLNSLPYICAFLFVRRPSNWDRH